jgi:hypothetical protein
VNDPRPFTFFVDRALGGLDVPSRLRSENYLVAVHDDHFPKDCRDVDWLPQVSGRGWIVLTKDKRIIRRELERRAIIDSNTAVFVLTAGDLKGSEQAEAFVLAMPRIARILRTHVRPIIATVTASGSVEIELGSRRGAGKKNS